ncbi:acetyl-CoA synthetase-like protein [Corynespora cassiicola Philippines]|uniref:Acetyl-CoA synthetase-like protein n=1 Tax=Corynespora cassiicola Philippines TaxID=1448308 RepID=A0A2T2P7V8_CORCC|nr:acetyl-CoA synthetase-like protein [Corynespora cassiicola Philippines]
MTTANHKLPQDPYLQGLEHLSRRLQPDHLIVVDHETGVKATITDLITDICRYRSKLLREINPEKLHGVREGKELFIATVLPPSYEFVVASLAILSLGAGLVPLSTKLVPKEVAYYVSQSGSKVVVCDQKRRKLVDPVPILLSTPDDQESTPSVQIVCLRGEELPANSPTAVELEFDSAWSPSLDAPSLILFTSGTSGPPKGALFSRKYLHDLSRVAIDALKVTHEDVFLHSRGVHWVSGIRWSLGMILAGARVEFCESKMNPAWWCYRIAQGGVTMCYEMPRIWMSIMRAIEDLPSTPTEGSPSMDAVKTGLNSARLFMSGGTPAIEKVISYWNQNLQRGSYVNMWGITELGGMLTYHDVGSRPSDKRCVGRLLPGVSIKYDEEGQICIKSPYMFLGYVNDSERTRQALDSEGFFKTGDAVDIHGGKLHLLGRIGFDYVRFKGLKLCAAEVEEKVNELSYVHESAVIPVPDEEFGQRVSVVIHPNSQNDMFALEKLRLDLEASLPLYKLPTILVLVDAPLARTENGKLAKRRMREEYLESELAPVLYRERWQISYGSGPRRDFEWDWGGMH